MKGLQLIDEKGTLAIKNIDLAQSHEGGKRLKILASALNHRDLWITKGKYPQINKGVVLGSDGVGDRNGELVLINPGLNWGDSEAAQSGEFTILGMPLNGTFGNVCMVPESHIHSVPEHLSLYEAAALPLTGVTAYRSLIVRGEATSGSKVFINGLGGGVALAACQMALSMGCQVYGTSGSDWKMTRAKSLGVQEVYDYNDDNWVKKFTSDFGGADVIIDGAGGPSFANLLKITNPGAKIISYGGTYGKIDGLSPQIIFWKQISIMGSTMGSEIDFKNMLDFVAIHKMRPVIDEVIPLSAAIKGFDKMEKGQQFGKIVFNHDI